MKRVPLVLLALSVVTPVYTALALGPYGNPGNPGLKVWDVPKPPPVKVDAVGIIEKATRTSCEYGTHLLKRVPDHPGHATYCLQSNGVKLNDYMGKKVRIDGEFMSGAPDLVNVLDIEEVYP